MRRLSVLLALLVILTVGVMPAAAITGGWEDSTNEYANVGAIVIHDVPDRDPWVTCSGTLIDEQVFLTAGHCTDYFQWLVDMTPLTEANFSVSFSHSDALDSGTWLPISEIITHPDYKWGPTSNPHDVGVLILAEPVSGITPAELPDQDFLNDLKRAGVLRQGSEGAKFTVVGYGATMEWPPPQITPGDGVRRFAESEYLKLLKAWLLMSQNQAPGRGDAGTCFGDSGGPAFYSDNGTEILVGITSWGDAVCAATGFNYRVDIPDTLEFIDDVMDDL